MPEAVEDVGQASVRIDELADHPDLVETLAGWHWATWGKPGAIRRTGLPILLPATDGWSRT